MNKKNPTIIGCTLGNCIHVAGIFRFFELAKECGYETLFVGASLSPEKILEILQTAEPDFMALSYRLTPSVAGGIFKNLQEKLVAYSYPKTTWLFGGTPPVCRLAAQSGLFAAVFDGTESDVQVIRWLRGDRQSEGEKKWASNLMTRLKDQKPYPILRHHFGLPDLEETIAGVQEIANSQTVDVISIGPDQNAQEYFFHPETMDHSQDGAGGVQLRKPEDLRRIYQASRCGNYPLLRIYSGTQNLLEWAKLSVKELHNAWGAIPLYWYSEMDGRSKRTIETAICENQKTMAWYGLQDIPVEVNEAHHWSLRGAPDEVAVVAAFLAAYNAKTQGVKDFILQLMWNTPPQIQPYQDLAKMLAKLEIVKSMESNSFRVWREVRAGLASLSPIANIAKGQLAASAMLALQINPHIIHVVGFCEGDHAATSKEVIESCEIVKGVIRNALPGLPEVTDSRVLSRQKELMGKANQLLREISALGSNAFTEPEILAGAVRKGILTAPQMMKK
ncbi:MAG TPA: methionine synthase, partial [Firmicutes bacterium]|nr:methionine synthase [Bacillota bacterium]